MPQINLGTVANDGTGSPLRSGGLIINQYGLLGDKTVNAAFYKTASITNEAALNLAIPAAALLGTGAAVWVPASMLPYNASLVTFNVNVKMSQEGGLDSNGFDVQAYGADPAGVLDATAAIQAATNASVHVLFTPGRNGLSGSYLISSAITSAQHGQVFRGISKGNAPAAYSVRVFTNLDIEMFKVQHDYVLFEGLYLQNTLSTATKRHIQSYGVAVMQVENCRIDGTTGTGTGGGIGFGNGSGGTGGSMGVVRNCIISDASIDVFTSDVKVSQTWVWPLSRPYGMKILGSNIQCTNVDIIPPLSTVSGKKAAFYITGQVFGVRLTSCFIDGNATLNTGVGILAENSVMGLVIEGLYAEQCDDNVVVLDSCVSPTVTGCVFKDNNRQGNSSSDILLQKSFSQGMDRCLISNNVHLMTSTIPAGSTGPAVKVASGTGRRGLQITNNMIIQPVSGGGYADQEITLVDGAFASVIDGSLSGNNGTRMTARVSGTVAVALNSTSDTFSYGPLALYYAPRIDQIHFSFQGSAETISPYYINGAPASSALTIGHAAAHPAFTLGFQIDLT